MENNQIYSSVDNFYVLGSIFVVDIEENETSIRLTLKGEYSLKVGDEGLTLLTLNTDKTLFTWAYTVLRRYGTSRTGFTFEAGRKSQSGPGVLRFSSPSGKLITQTIKQYVNRIKGDNSITKPEPSNLISPKSNNFQDPISGDYTEFSQTTGRPKRKLPKSADPHNELSLELPRQYVNHRLAAGPTLSHPVNVVSQVAIPRSPNNAVSPYGVSQSSSSYNTVGNNTVLVDSYSESYGSSLHSSQPVFPSFNQSVPFPTDVMNPENISSTPFYTPHPSIPLPYHSIKRPQRVTDSSDDTLMNDYHVSCDTTASVFPTCVSPILKTDSEDSSDGEVYPTSRKISQASTSVKELSADLDLTSIQESEDYINLKRDSLIRTMSNPISTREQNIRTAITPKYLNVASHSENSTDDYYNITSCLLGEKKRSNTGTLDKCSSELDTQKELNFSITPGPVRSSIDDIFKSECISKPLEDDDMVYGDVQYFPYQPQPTSDQVYINAPTQFKPAYENVQEHTRLDHDYTDQPVSIVSQTLPSSPTKSCLISSLSQPSTIKLKPRLSPEKPISSQYSFLTEVLGNTPQTPPAYKHVEKSIF